MAKMKQLLLIALFLFNVINSTYSYFIPQNEEAWSLKIEDMTTKRSTSYVDQEKIVNILKSLTEKLKEEEILEIPTTKSPVEVKNELNSILKSLTEKLRDKNIIATPRQAKDIPLALESLSQSSESMSESSEKDTHIKQKPPLIIGLQKIGLKQLVLENMKKEKESARTDEEVTEKYRSIFEFDEADKFIDPFLSRFQRSNVDKPINENNFTLLLKYTDDSKPLVLKYMIIETIKIKNKKHVDPKKYEEPDPPNFFDKTLRLNDYSPKPNDDRLRLRDYSLRSDDNSLEVKSTDETPVIHMDTMIEDYYKIFNDIFIDNKKETKPKSIRIVDSELPIDIEFATSRKNMANTPGFGISMKDLNDAMNRLKSNGKHKRVVIM